MNLKAIFLMGPTASGKTACALHLARHFPVEIISVDSALVYQGMDIGTAKPSVAELSSCPHHLVDIISPMQAYSAAQFCADAARLITQVQSCGKIPLLVGGTMLYFKALRDGLSDLPQANAEIRSDIETRAHAEGWPALHAELAKRDPQAAERLKPNDAQRIQRALEIVTLTGQPLANAYAQRSASPEHAVDYLPLALQPSDRASLHARIAQRFDLMLANGFEAEVQALRAHYALTPEMTSMRCVGYRQMWDYIDGNMTQNELRESGIAATRQLAKRQITWLRQFRNNWPELREFDSLAPHYSKDIGETIKTWLNT
jgi:tRNA dimethylallyltransferase